MSIECCNCEWDSLLPSLYKYGGVGFDGDKTAIMIRCSDIVTPVYVLVPDTVTATYAISSYMVEITDYSSFKGNVVDVIEKLKKGDYINSYNSNRHGGFSFLPINVDLNNGLVLKINFEKGLCIEQKSDNVLSPKSIQASEKNNINTIGKDIYKYYFDKDNQKIVLRVSKMTNRGNKEMICVNI
tara:strand:+ start:317 stop:868 length:552 start_codon:yes stop_codon:yes gene_type:complete